MVEESDRFLYRSSDGFDVEEYLMGLLDFDDRFHGMTFIT